MTNEVLGGPPFAVGDIVDYPDGRKVKIVSGTYWADGGLSNHWEWREILPDGSLGPKEAGYGWREKPL